MVGRFVSFRDGFLASAMLVSGSVTKITTTLRMLLWQWQRPSRNAQSCLGSSGDTIPDRFQDWSQTSKKRIDTPKSMRKYEIMPPRQVIHGHEWPHRCVKCVVFSSFLHSFLLAQYQVFPQIKPLQQKQDFFEKGLLKGDTVVYHQVIRNHQFHKGLSAVFFDESPL